MAKYYPIYMDIENKPVLVVGGGNVALRKVKTLLEYGAIVRIVSPKLVPELEQLLDGVRCVWVPKKYSTEDIQDAILVFACTERDEVNAQIARDAKTNYRPINVVDDPDKCSFIVPSILSRGDLSIAVSTGGSSPLVARKIREELEAVYTDEMEIYLDLLRIWRQEVKEKLPVAKRAQFWNQVTDGKVLQLIKEGRIEQAKEVMVNCFRSLLA